MTADAAGFIAAQFDRWRTDPVAFVEEFGRCGTLWGKQRELLEAVRDHRRVACAAGNGLGKTHAASWLVWWWVLCHRTGSAKVVITAPSRSTAQAVLAAAVTARWEELCTIYTPEERVLLGLGERPTLRGWSAPWNAESGIEWFATKEDEGRGTGHASRAAGRHADHLLFLFEEFGGISKAIYDSVQGSMFGAHRHFLGVGNPVDPASVFAKCYRSPDFHPIRISALEFPNVTERRAVLPYGPTWESIEEAKREYGEDSGFFEWKVLGRFPTRDTESLISSGMLERAFLRRPDPRGCPHAVADLALGVDVARSTAAAADWTVTYAVCGRCHQIIDTTRHHGQDTVTTAGRTIALAEGLGMRPDAAWQISVDDGGVGGGVTDNLRAQGWWINAVNFAGKPESSRNKERFRNRRMELWWLLKEWLADAACLAGLSEVERERLREDVTAPRFWPLGDGRVLVLEAKDDVRARLGRSPDDGDALALAVSGLRRIDPTFGARGNDEGPMTKYDIADQFSEALRRGEAWAVRQAAWSDIQLGNPREGVADVFRDR